MTHHHTRSALVEFLNRKVAEQDWAAVSDAANELSVFDILEARAPATRVNNASRAAAKN